MDWDRSRVESWLWLTLARDWWRMLMKQYRRLFIIEKQKTIGGHWKGHHVNVSAISPFSLISISFSSHFLSCFVDVEGCGNTKKKKKKKKKKKQKKTAWMDPNQAIRWTSSYVLISVFEPLQLPFISSQSFRPIAFKYFNNE